MGFTRRTLIQSAALAAPIALAGIEAASAASDAAEIDRDSKIALARLFQVDSRAKTLAHQAAGILIFPRVVKAGFIFGGQGGKGELRAGGHVRGYYTIVAASFGLQAGVAWFSYGLFFMNDRALHYLDKSDGWAIGTDPNVVIVNQGAGTTLNSTTLAKDVIGFPFGQKGLMADLSLQGTKITSYNPNA